MPGRTRLVLVSLLAAALAGCGAAAEEPSPVPTTTIDLPASYRYVPESARVDVGATVTWTNNDHFTHSVQFLDGGLPTDPLVMEPGASTSFTFEEAGTYAYQCHLHPQDMTGSVTVTP